MKTEFNDHTEEYTCREMLSMSNDRRAELASKLVKYKSDFDELMDIAVALRGHYICSGFKLKELDEQSDRLMKFIVAKNS